jgi:5-deoxy-glucuronate isomerase
MPQLQLKPFGSHGKTHEITPASAGWRYVGFSLYCLRAGEKAAELTGANEVILVMVEGKAQITAAGRDWGVLGDRMDVFEKPRPIAFMCQMTAIGLWWRRPIARSRFVPRLGIHDKDLCLYLKRKV